MPQADIWTVSGLSLQTVGAPGGMRQMWQGRFTHDDSTSEGDPWLSGSEKQRSLLVCMAARCARHRGARKFVDDRVRQILRFTELPHPRHKRQARFARWGDVTLPGKATKSSTGRLVHSPMRPGASVS